MKQLIQNFKTGELYVDDVPVPSISKGYVLVANSYSLISAGTEKSTVSTAKASLLGKAKKRPDLVKQVFDNYKKEGLRATLQKVTTKLESPKALGYSTAGVVLVSMDTEQKFKPGDPVACAGADYASHAGVVAIPQNLIAKIPDDVSLEEACFTTLGSIALQGVRQSEPKIGDNICVIGLGLLGQLTCQLLKANGCHVLGIDVDNRMIDLANNTKAAMAISRNDSNLMTILDNFTHGYGFDSVIITAATQSNDPIELSAKILRKKGQVIVVGAVKMDVPRDPDFYRKELELKMSCSYGPGRYDPEYEEYGQDYPYGYVRWTEQRNMEAFLTLIANKALNLKPLITHSFDIKDAVKAYDIILGKTKEDFVGIVLKYDTEEEKRPVIVKVNNNAQKDINIGFIGAGSFAQSYLIPYAKNLGSLDTVVTRTGINAKNVAKKFGFNKTSSDIKDILNNKNINTVFIATRHNTHFDYALQSIQNNKNVFIEKPLCVNTEELEKIIAEFKKQSNPPRLMVGFNRRFADVSVQFKNEFKSIGEPLVMNFRVNAGFIPKDHWTQTEEGAGRIVGEICHFIDLMQFFTDSQPTKVFAECIDANSDILKNDDNISITIKFKDGSVGNLIYTANGDKAMPKERFEIYGGNQIAVIDDFRKGTLYKNSKTKKIENAGKGHKQEVDAFIRAIQNGSESPISFESICYTTLTTFKIQDSLSTGLPQEILLDFS